MLRASRMAKELQRLAQEPPPGISCCMKADCMDQLEAQIVGSDNSPYSAGVFKLEIQVPERYPMEPPKVRFLTPIYHPNIDTAGRICLDLLKMPPAGSWKPSQNIATLLTSIRLLMSEPNPDDPLMTDISEEFQANRALFDQKAKSHTEKYATKGVAGHLHASKEDSSSSDDSESSSSEEEEEEAAEEKKKKDNALSRGPSANPRIPSQAEKRQLGDAHPQIDAKKLKLNP